MSTSDASRRRASWTKRPLVAVLGLVALGWSDDLAGDRAVVARDTVVFHAGARGPARPPIHGTSFPDGVLALTWDDGPDSRTIDLARYLHDEKVSATFFVVGEWIEGVSEEPGVGADLHATGHRHLPVLADLVALGHRIGSHTTNHVLLDGASEVDAAAQLGESQREIDPFLANELRVFRAPGGYFSRSVAAAIAEPFFADLVGPVHWDIDAKDWEGSLYCRSSRPASECERGPLPGRTRVRPDVIARRYAARAVSARRGIVLLHDRVGDVGSSYALDVARALVPQLEARGFVFTAPILSFGPLTRRLAIPPGTSSPGAPTFADIDGDGREDLCREEGGAIACARASAVADHVSPVPRTELGAPKYAARVPSGLRSMDVADVDGDGLADLCLMTDDAIDCALAADDGGFRRLRRWSTQLTPLRRSVYAASFRLADVDGDGRADACAVSGEGVVCATSTGGTSFGPPRTWLTARVVHDGTPLQLADLDRDGRADLCGNIQSRTGPKTRGVGCALSTGHMFGPVARWSALGDLENGTSIRVGDLNGDGRADVCAAEPSGLRCALSNGRGFKQSSVWSDSRATDFRLADINGDRRADLCAFTRTGVECGLAP